MVGLADCNNFFVSCERTQDMNLEGKAVVVMSNNDGCIVARSNEAKALGIKMGQPAFEIRDLINSGQVIAISGHHLLYREISIRVHAIFRKYVPHAIDYSVDEAFLDMDGIPHEYLPEIGRAICKECWDKVHIPITIGFAQTKTLAKIITEVCKKRRENVGLLSSQEDIEDAIRRLSISDLWGIGRKLTKRLYMQGIYTIFDFYSKDRMWVRNLLGINGEKSWLELHGIKAIELSHVERTIQDSISETRTFPQDTSDYDYLRARISIYATDCCSKLRGMKAVCRYVTVFLRTNKFHPEKGIYCPQITMPLASPTAETMDIVKCAVIGLQSIYNPDACYKRAGIVLTGISPVASLMKSIFDSDYSEDERMSNPMFFKALDKINKIPGCPSLKLASQLTKGHKGHNDGYSSSFQAPSAKLKNTDFQETSI